MQQIEKSLQGLRVVPERVGSAPLGLSIEVSCQLLEIYFHE